MKISSIPNIKIIGFALVIVICSILAVALYFYSSVDRPTQKRPQSVVQSGGPTLAQAQTDAKAAMDLGPGTSANVLATSKPEASGLARNEEVVKPTTQPGQDGAASVANKKASAAIGSPDARSSTPAEWAGPTLGDLEKLRSENAMLAEQLKNAELKTKIAKEGSVPGIPGTINPNVAQSPGATNSARGPRVLMIAGGENNYRANVLMPNGQTITALAGTAIAGYGAVSTITPNEVLFGSGKSKRSLPLVGNSANSDFVMGQ